MYKKITLIFILIIIIFTLISCNNQSPPGQESSLTNTARVENIKIQSDNLEVKKGAGNSFDTITTLNSKDIVEVIGEIDDWYVIRLDNNTVGCVPSDTTRPIIKNQTTDNKNTNPDSLDATENLTTMEERMLNLMNREREKNNLKKFNIDRELTSIARIKAQDLSDNNYFSHYSPNYGSPFDMLNEFGVNYLKAGENLAANSNLARAHESLMKSSGHRKNILSTEFTHTGVGVKPDKENGYIFVQLFIKK